MQKFYQSDTSVMAGTAGKDLATFRHAKTWESRKTCSLQLLRQIKTYYHTNYST